jgi:hypothetical protein
MSGMLLMTQDGGAHRARDITANLDECEFLMPSQSKRFHSLDLLYSSRSNGRATEEHQNDHGGAKSEGENPEHQHET